MVHGYGMWKAGFKVSSLVATASILRTNNSQIFRSPLHFLNHVQGCVYNELVHMSSLLSELGRTITTTGFRGAEFMLEEWIVFRPDDAEVVRHIDEAGSDDIVININTAPNISTSRPL
jgi:hypothetical protein